MFLFSKLSTPTLLRLGVVTLAACSLHAQAMQPLITDDTGTQGPGGNQFEFSLAREKTRAGDSTARAYSLPVVYTRGVSETVDVFAGVGFARVRGEDARTSGFASPSIGAKWRFYDVEASGTSFAVKPEIIFPVSAAREAGGLGVGKTSGNLTLIASQELPFGSVHVNAGVGRERYRDAATADARARRFSLAPVWDVSSEWKLAADLGVESTRAGGARLRSKFVELAAIYSPKQDVDFAVGLIRSRDNDDPKSTTQSINAGVTLRFE